ncbi:hypothetical protein HJ107_17795 [Vibrio parahaemolyticus]|uniref:D-glucuronyl C5-epimerase family protein n=1 Tax=Vibrio parahaemolyticus TaxID=670 RepID=UPI00111DF298|nr:D-glucuronyl C5-epimerase family protein [Vibrio parahaemolyticus]EGQ8197845.1 hypothetical protein [Vibrio parahaemolyticus]ELA6921435.1 hypothetical protein [Vibrio parahaemolyticus]MBE4088676.1 hypothetical protein [Vibrio parahaemolyticus]MCR9716258.1 D-glucuronyl C5-epimerase family protein [Vibrio parahaemolyticus]MCX8936336.1 D-glucuronyl C5-epimerase family protein [Vibrio parahaemolyticus]
MSKNEATNSYKSFSTIAPYFGFKVSDYWHVDYKIISESSFNYYWDLKEKYTYFEGDYDSRGLPLYLGADSKKHYSVIFLGHYALGAFQTFLETSCNKAKADFLLVCDFLVESTCKYKSCDGIWVNSYPMKLYGLSNNWASGLAQAKGISCLVRAFHLTKERKYLESAIVASKSFFISVADGGILAEDKGMDIFEEYPTEKPSMVLNGHMFGIFALNDLLKEELKEHLEVEFRSSIEAKFEKSIIQLEKNIERWDTTRWSKYDNWSEHKHVASLFYHDLHIKQLFILFKITDNPKFLYKALEWESKRSSFINRMFALMSKVYFRVCGRL